MCGLAADSDSVHQADNPLIAQHRDKLRYATVRGGGYLSVLREFQTDDFVYLKRCNLDTMQSGQYAAGDCQTPSV